MSDPIVECPSCEQITYDEDPEVNECSYCGYPNRIDTGREET